MLKYESKLTYDDEIITKSDSILTLECATEDLNIFGMLKLSNEVVKTLEFVRQQDGYYRARLIITEEDINYIVDNTFLITVVDQGLSRKSNKVTLKFDLSTVRLNIKQKVSKELTEVKLQLKELEQKLNAVLTKHRVLGINISDYSYAKKGMIPVAIDDKGNFVLAFPFTNTINKVNGIESVDQEVTVTADVIPYSESANLKEKMEAIINAISQVNSAVQTLTETQTTLINKVANLETEVAALQENPII